MKRCFKCNKRKALTQFYRHKEMGDGHLGKCKSCTKADVKKRYYDPESRARIIAYERKRAQTARRRAYATAMQARQRRTNPGRYRARSKVASAVKSGLLVKLPCKVCKSSTVEAHHTDYRKPLAVTWLCRKHHLQAEGKQTYSV